MEVESKASARMSLEMEQLQWRIRHNLDLPPVQLRHTNSPQNSQRQQLSLEEVCSLKQGDNDTTNSERPQSAPAVGSGIDVDR